MARNNVWRYTLCSLYIFGHLGKNIKKGKRCQEDCTSYLFGSKQGDWASKGRLIHLVNECSLLKRAARTPPGHWFVGLLACGLEDLYENLFKP